jgi:hypothetical protein
MGAMFEYAAQGRGQTAYDLKVSCQARLALIF